MGQMRLKEGQDRPRWRAKQRHRQDRVFLSQPDLHDRLTGWIGDHGWEERGATVLEALDLTSYLRESAHIDLPPAERLRKLAIALENELAAAPQPRGWLALERIYNTGKALDPEDAEIDISRAITAEFCASCLDDCPEIRHRMIQTGKAAARRAIELRPDEARAHYVLGMLDYSFKYGSIESALGCFEVAVALDPCFGWARLYRAHCLHDLGRWSEAAQAYSDVDPAFLVGPLAWRYDLLREQFAWCLLQAGDREGALAAFSGLLDRYELQPKLIINQTLQELTAAAEGPLRAELSERLVKLCRRITE